ncbi:hypothetical protein EVAR_103465_1 [Eumeta japonica]|uniref:Uncharacterized protein n=1 Tax=Eumeta variegata TaxID=151549 RepID=A0A4C1YY34_EUMVA|nr:hypothetical protein EVAR_103465_1 [Eumeta japonica]
MAAEVLMNPYYVCVGQPTTLLPHNLTVDRHLGNLALRTDPAQRWYPTTPRRCQATDVTELLNDVLLFRCSLTYDAREKEAQTGQHRYAKQRQTYTDRGACEKERKPQFERMITILLPPFVWLRAMFKEGSSSTSVRHRHRDQARDSDRERERDRFLIKNAATRTEKRFVPVKWNEEIYSQLDFDFELLHLRLAFLIRVIKEISRHLRERAKQCVTDVSSDR